MKVLIKIPFMVFLLPLLLITSSCGVSRSNVENAKNLEYQIDAFSKDPGQAQQLIKAMRQSAETFMAQQEPKKILALFEEVYNSLPKGAVPVEQIQGHALVKSYILEAYSDAAKSSGLEKQAIQFLEALQSAYEGDAAGKKAASPLVNKYIESLKQPASAE